MTLQPGTRSIMITTSQAISAGAATVAVSNASVIEDVDYASSSIVTIKDVILNNGQVAGALSSAVHVAADLVTPVEWKLSLNGFDAVLAARLLPSKILGPGSVSNG